MKRLALITGVALLAAARSWALYEPAKLPDPSRRWSVSLNTRGEYDDNVDTSATDKKSSFKAIAEPQLLVNIPTEQTFIGFRYNYQATYYENRSTDPVDQSHTADLTVSHTVTPRLVLDFRDSVRRGIEPELVNDQTGDPFIRRRRGDFLYNTVGAGVNYNFSRRWTMSVHGDFDYWNYDDAAASVDDRNVYRASLQMDYSIDPRTTGGIGYQFASVNYSQPGTNDLRNSDSHIVYLSMVRRFNPQFSVQGNAGVELREFGDGSTDVGPWVNTSATYNYGPESSVTLGFRYSITTTEVGFFRSADAADIYAQLTHRITTKFSVSGGATFSLDSFANPTGVTTLTSPTEETVSLNLTLRYQFTRWCSGNAGYNFDQVSSDIAGRDFTRNRVSLGCRLEY